MNNINNILTGAAMGAALTTAGVYSPDIILSQFNFSDFTMLQTFLSAAAGSTLIVTLSQTLHLTSLPPRTPSTLGLLPTRYDANILGGALLGAGMAISGACPGSVLAQIGVGVRSGRYAFLGAVAGGVFWGWLKRRSKSKGTERRGLIVEVVEKKEGVREGKEKKEKRAADILTVYEALGVSRDAMLVGLEAAFVLAVAGAVKYANASAGEARGIPPYLAGLAISAAQFISIVLRGQLLGASSGFEELGGWLWGGRNCANVLLSAGLVGGAWLASWAAPALRPVTEVAISPVRSVLGGFLIVVGARMAGGCTSGHGISGLSLMSISSFVTVAAIFGVGALTGLLIG